MHLKIQEDLVNYIDLNEWTLINQALFLLFDAYITTCCRHLLRVLNDKAADEGGVRPDLKILLKGRVTVKVLLCEVALEELDLLAHFTRSHKDSMKLPTVMRDHLEEQLRFVPVQHAGVFGILMGKHQLMLYIVKYLAHL